MLACPPAQLFATIGEMFDDLNVVGVTMSIRSSRDMLSVWNKDNNNPETKFRIGCVLVACAPCALPSRVPPPLLSLPCSEKLKQILGLQESATVEYKNHRDSMKDYSTYKNGTAFVYTPKLGASASPAITAASPGLTASAAPFVSRSPALGAGATLAEMALLSLEPPALAQAV